MKNNRKKLLEAARAKNKLIYQKDLEDANVLANQPSEDDLFYTLEEIAILIEDLMDIDVPTDANGRILEVRPKGHWFEFEVAKRLGYNYPPGAGLFPDIRHQAMEIKHHTGKNITVDFGRYHPGSDEIINETWNRKIKLKVNQIRYLIALAPPPQFKVTTLILLTGAQIASVFGVSPKATIKYQMGISDKWRDTHRGKMMVGEKIWLET
ncbi:MAG: hypothetical protein ONB46_19670 [candidate division KSB1 bacterium]|nr:hypothetical protein [candidate division KSB1 bacterium]MDZ7368096.1 hypothetical protein [candidate division KSB1 bacterium]MDZ7405678.1 hypothetical protein [candidate division KSB1 bacterium]